jgi:hypothetical protein
MKVDVYWNLHRQLFSIRSREKETYGRVISHAPSLGLYWPKPVVSEAGRQRVLREGKKNVHAVIRGELDMWSTKLKGWADHFEWGDHDETYQWMYNPYTMSDFQFAAPHQRSLHDCSDHRWNYVFMQAKPGLHNRKPHVIGGMTP